MRGRDRADAVQSTCSHDGNILFFTMHARVWAGALYRRGVFGKKLGNLLVKSFARGDKKEYKATEIGKATET